MEVGWGGHNYGTGSCVVARRNKRWGKKGAVARNRTSPFSPDSAHSPKQKSPGEGTFGGGGRLIFFELVDEDEGE